MNRATLWNIMNRAHAAFLNCVHFVLVYSLSMLNTYRILVLGNPPSILAVSYRGLVAKHISMLAPTLTHESLFTHIHLLCSTAEVKMLFSFPGMKYKDQK